MATLEENIERVISDFDAIKTAIQECGVKVPDGTDTSEYGNLVRRVKAGEPKQVIAQIITTEPVASVEFTGLSIKPPFCIICANCDPDGATSGNGISISVNGGRVAMTYQGTWHDKGKNPVKIQFASIENKCFFYALMANNGENTGYLNVVDNGVTNILIRPTYTGKVFAEGAIFTLYEGTIDEVLNG